MQVKERVNAEIDRTQDAMITWLQRLIQFPSITGDEGPAQTFVAESLREIGASVEVWELDQQALQAHPAYGRTPLSYAGRPNVIGHFPGTGGGRSLILNGHVDVVPIEDPAFWKVDPWSGTIIEGRMYGRGASDMKASLAAMLWATRALQATTRLRGDVLIESVVDEETTGNGTLATVLCGYTADGAIVGEPTSMDLVPGHQGLFWFRLTVPGISAHAAYRAQGVNAIEKAYLFYWGLRDLETQRNQGKYAERFGSLFTHVPIAAPISVGRFSAGNYPGTVPDSAVLEGRVGVWLGETVAEAKVALEAAVAQITEQDSFLRAHPPKLEYFGSNCESAQLALDHPFAQVVGEVLRPLRPHFRVWGQTPGNDLRHFILYGNTPCVMVGPGDDPLSHTANESVDIGLLVTAVKFYAHLALEWCG
jgi:acetylornithine deacetylase